MIPLSSSISIDVLLQPYLDWDEGECDDVVALDGAVACLLSRALSLIYQVTSMDVPVPELPHTIPKWTSRKRRGGGRRASVGGGAKGVGDWILSNFHWVSAASHWVGAVRARRFVNSLLRYPGVAEVIDF